jgi:hypothetical protein
MDKPAVDLGSTPESSLNPQSDSSRVGVAHRFPGVYAFELVGGAHPAKNMRE